MSEFRVFSAHRTKVAVPAVTSDGKKITGQMPALVVELVGHGHDEWRKSLEWTEVCETDAEMDSAVAKFAVGRIVTFGGFSAAEGAAKK